MTNFNEWVYVSGFQVVAIVKSDGVRESFIELRSDAPEGTFAGALHWHVGDGSPLYNAQIGDRLSLLAPHKLFEPVGG